MGTIDASIVNVAVPHMRGAVGATVQEITWVTTGFVIATVIVMPLTAFLGNLFGQKRLYLFSLVLFVVGSVLCGLARSLETLVGFRVLQGLGAGALQPTEQAILRQTFPPREQGMAMALFALAVIVGPAVGPSLGGYIVDNYSWPWIFFINVPVGALALFMVTRFVHEPEDIRRANREMAQRRRGNMDWAGIALLAGGLASLQFVLEEGNKHDWFTDRTIVVFAIVAAIALVAFVARELTAPVPAVNLYLFRDGVFLAGTLVSAVMFALLMAVTFLLPVFLQEMLGFTALQSGLALMPRALVMMAVTPIVGRLYNHVSPRLFVAAGVLLVSLSVYEMSHYTLAIGTRDVVRALLVQGLGFSFLFVPLTTVALSRIPRARLPDATGLNSLLRQLGGSFGLAIFATLLTRHTTRTRAGLAHWLAAGRPEMDRRVESVARFLMGRGADPASAHAAGQRLVEASLQQQSIVIAFEHVFLMCGLSFLMVLPLVLFLRRPAESAGAPGVVEA